MADSPNFFDGFEPVSKAEWLEKVQADLKGQLPETLNWAIGEALSISPFAHREDLPAPPRPLHRNEPTNDWEIVEPIFCGEDLTLANTQALEGLQLGAQALRIHVDRVLNQTDLEDIFSDIHLDFISVHFQSTIQPEAMAQQLEILKKWAAAQPLKGSFCGPDKVLSNGEFLSYLKDFEGINVALAGIDGRLSYQGPEEVITELSSLLLQAERLLALGQENDIALPLVHQNLHFQIALETTYFLNIAKVRALKMLWANIQQAYQLDLPMPKIEGYTTLEVQTEDPYTNMIRSTIQAMGGIVGGVDRLLVYPANQQHGEPSSFTRRVARNLQHILKMESHFDEVVDPAAGSYYLEQLTTQIAEKTWIRFQQLV